MRNLFCYLAGFVMSVLHMSLIFLLTDAGVVGVLLLGSGELSTSDTELVDSRDSFSWLSSVSSCCIGSSSVSDSRVLSSCGRATLSSASSVSIVSSDDRGTAESASGSFVSVIFWVFFAALSVGHNAFAWAEGFLLTSVEFESSVKSITEAELTGGLFVRLIKPSRGPRPFFRAGLGCRAEEVASTSFSPSEALDSWVGGAEDAVLVLLVFTVSLGSGLSLLNGRRAGIWQNTLKSENAHVSEYCQTFHLWMSNLCYRVCFTIWNWLLSRV